MQEFRRSVRDATRDDVALATVSKSPRPSLPATMTEEALLAWFNDHAKPFLETYASERVKPLTSDAQRLEALRKVPLETIVCCLGNAGIGKSTLINALVAGRNAVNPCDRSASREISEHSSTAPWDRDRGVRFPTGSWRRRQVPWRCCAPLPD